MTSNRYWRVALPCPLKQLFVYGSGAPAAPSADVSSKVGSWVPQVGSWVIVPFGNRRVRGIILESCEKPQVSYEIKPLDEVVSPDFRLPKDLVDLVLWSIRYYHAAPWETLTTFVPNRIVQGKTTEPEPLYASIKAGENKISTRAKRQKELWCWLEKFGPVQASEVATAGFSRSLLKQLVEVKAVESIGSSQLEPSSDADSATSMKKAVQAVQLLEPTVDQQSAIDRVETKAAGTFLLEGVTGSGKTLIYLHLAQRHIAMGRQVLILVPEIGLVPQMFAACQKLAEQPFCYHSGMTDTERADAWIATKSGKAKIVIGTRSAVFLPFNNLSLIVADEEHDSSYKQQEGMRYQARDLAVVRAAQMSVPILLGTATPSLESLYNLAQGNFAHLQLLDRVAGGALPEWRVLEGKPESDNAGLLAESLSSMQKHLSAGNQVLVFINRRGYAPCLRCSQCGWQASCDGCDSRYTYHKSFNELRCHRCDVRRAVPRDCPICHSRKLSFLGQGTERIADRLSDFFPDTPVIRIDRDATKGKQGVERKLEEVHSSGAAILVGTQMLAKGHHFPNLSMVLILDIDYAMLSTDFRATEQCMQLVTQVAGRAGRETLGAEVILQSEFANHPMLVNLVENRYGQFAQDLMRQRQQLDLPPYCYMAILRAESADYRLALDLLKESAQLAHRSGLRGCKLVGPMPSPTEKRSDRYRFQLQITCAARSGLHELLSLILEGLNPASNPKSRNKKLRWHLDLDPISLD